MLTKISIQVSHPMPGPLRPEYTRTDVLKKIEDYIRDVNSNLIDSPAQWQYLKRVYTVLAKKQELSIIEKQIMKILQPEIMKHAEYDSRDSVKLDGVDMMRHMTQDEEQETVTVSWNISRSHCSLKGH